jgi:hypothetical protein
MNRPRDCREGRVYDPQSGPLPKKIPSASPGGSTSMGLPMAIAAGTTGGPRYTRRLTATPLRGHSDFIGHVPRAGEWGGSEYLAVREHPRKRRSEHADPEDDLGLSG